MLLRIAYVVQLDLSSESGVIKKILSQMHIWGASSHEARLFAITPSQKEWHGLDSIQKTIESRSSGLISRLHAARRLERLLREWNPDIVYMRYGIYYPSWRSLCRLFPVVVEINTDDSAEYRLMLSRPKYVYHRLTRNIVPRNAAGLVFVTHELSQKYRKHSASSTVIPNGIDMSRIEPDGLPKANGDRKQMVFVGSPRCPWHGMDVILFMAQQLPEYDFQVIGYSERDVGKGLPRNLIAHGYLAEQEYRSILCSSHIAIGSLAVDRAGLHEASPLKTREYLAYGLPVIVAYDDSDFIDGAPFILRLNIDERTCGKTVSRVREFVEAWADRRVPRTAVEHIDAGIKEEQRLAFMQEVLCRWKRYR